jgi:hypothetical protein
MRQLPPFKAMQHVLKSVTRYWPVGFRIALPWMIVLALAQIIISFVQIPDDSAARGGLDFVIIAIALFAVSSIAVSWHRFILLDEAPDANNLFRIDRPVRRYLLRFITCILAATMIAIIPLLIFSALWPQAVSLVPAVGFGAYILTVIFSISLPPAALERPSIKLMDTIRSIRGNELNMFGFAVLNFGVLVAGILVTMLLVSPLGLLPTAVVRILLPIITLPINVLTTLISISAVTTAYGYFIERRDF